MNNKRTLFVIFLMVFFFAVLFFKLFEIQISKHEDYDYYAKNQQTESITLRAERGFILDRNGELLAYDRNDVSFFVDTRMLKVKDKATGKLVFNNGTVEKIAARFSSVFGKTKNYYIKLMKGSSKNVCLEKKVSKSQSIKLKDFVVDGLFSIDDPTRVYSYDNRASHIMGYVNNDYKGYDGVEKYYNKELTGIDGKMLINQDVRGRMVTVNEDATVKPLPGNSIYLTINNVYQRIVEEELKKGLEQFQGSSATAIIMDPNNGEILALANLPDYDPNSYWKFNDESRRNTSLTDTYEPGSTFKAISISTLLDKNLCSGSERVFAENGKYKYKKKYISDSHKLQWVTVKEVIEQSSNIGMAKLIPRIDEDDFYLYMRNYGFGNFTFIDLPGETRGRLKKPSSYDEYTQVTMSYGYGVAVTPVQLVTAYSALVNGGLLYQPYLLKKQMTRDGKVIKETEPKMLRRVINKETSEKVKDFLLGVVENGTAKITKIENLSIGGKTGTSKQLVDNKYSSQNYNSSFVGFFPVKNPKVVCLVLVNAPQVGRYGGMVAAPIFRDITRRLISYDSNLLESSDENINNENTFEKVFVEVKKQDTQKYNNYAQINRKEFESPKIKLNKKIMPDLRNINLRDALAMLNQVGIKCKVSGSGRVVSQSIMPGEAIKPGMNCVLICEEKKLSGVRIN